mmetsp:Transcript_50493/g.83788  ORF Transcript_50493/g.83788 Transcript_50493/m.83788 type:complete len:211 (-) Transcript_50493:134-766(-)
METGSSLETSASPSSLSSTKSLKTSSTSLPMTSSPVGSPLRATSTMTRSQEETSSATFLCAGCPRRPRMRSRKTQQARTCVSSRRRQAMDARTSSNRSSSSTSESPSLPFNASLLSLVDLRSSSTPLSLVASECLSLSSLVRTSISSSILRPPPANTSPLFVAVITKPSALLTLLSRTLWMEICASNTCNSTSLPVRRLLGSSIAPSTRS